MYKSAINLGIKMKLDSYLLSIFICAFLFFALGNMIIRFTVFRIYQKLREKDIDIPVRFFFQEKVLIENIAIYDYEDQKMILAFVRRTKYAMIFATILISIILVMGFLLFRMN
jgi:hypothetical protein